MGVGDLELDAASGAAGFRNIFCKGIRFIFNSQLVNKAFVITKLLYGRCLTDLYTNENSNVRRRMNSNKLDYHIENLSRSLLKLN